MYSANFDYHRARSLAEAQQLLAAHPGAKLLAGGHSLIPLMKLRLARHRGYRHRPHSGTARHLAQRRTRFESVRSPRMRSSRHRRMSGKRRRRSPRRPGLVGDPAVRNRGTIGGNIAHADPASDLPTVLVALGARIVVVGPSGERTIDAPRFFTGIMMTALADDEIVDGGRGARGRRGQGSAYVKFSHPASRYAVIGAAALITVTRGTCSAVSVAIGGLLPHARRLPAVETSADRPARRTMRRSRPPPAAWPTDVGGPGRTATFSPRPTTARPLRRST